MCFKVKFAYKLKKIKFAMIVMRILAFMFL